ncbi:hypothetical protein IAR50_002824 [Cryptococcus sp. DSM 104548]
MPSSLTPLSAIGDPEPPTKRRSSRRVTILDVDSSSDIIPASTPPINMVKSRLEGKGTGRSSKRERRSLVSGRRTLNRLSLKADAQTQRERRVGYKRAPYVELPVISSSKRKAYVEWGLSGRKAPPQSVTQESGRLSKRQPSPIDPSPIDPSPSDPSPKQPSPEPQPSPIEDSQQYDPSMIDDVDVESQDSRFEITQEYKEDDDDDCSDLSRLESDTKESKDKGLNQESGSEIREPIKLCIKSGKGRMVERQLETRDSSAVSGSNFDRWASESSESTLLAGHKRKRTGTSVKPKPRGVGRLRKNPASVSGASDGDQSFKISLPKARVPSRTQTRRGARIMELESEGEEEVDELMMSWEEDDDSEIPPIKSRRGGREKRQAPTPSPSRSPTPEPAPESILANHRDYCERCSRPPTTVIAEQFRTRKKKPGPKRKKKADDDMDDVVSDGELVQTLGGWVTCKSCCISTHYDCLGAAQKKVLLNDLYALDVAAAISSLAQDPSEDPEALETTRKAAESQVSKRKEVKIDEEAEFTCAKCKEFGGCTVCWKTGIDVQAEPERQVEAETGDGSKLPEGSPKAASANGDELRKVELVKHELEEVEKVRKVMFRCRRCRLSAHYEHLPQPKSLGENPSLAEVALHYQTQSYDGDAWVCHLCRDFAWEVDMVIAWRPDSSSPLPVDPALDQPPFKANLARDYLIKFRARPFRHLTWVPHTWLSSIAPQKLRRFLEQGPLLDIVTNASMAAKGDEVGVGRGGASIAKVLELEGKNAQGIVGPEEDAKSNIPVAWSTVDRVLDIKLLRPTKKQINSTAKISKGKNKAQRNRQRVLSISSDSEDAAAELTARSAAKTPFEVAQKKFDLPDGISLPVEEMVEIEEWEVLVGRAIGEEDVDEIEGFVAWALVKWDDLQYDQACWDTPPPLSSPLYPAFKTALRQFLHARHIKIPVLTPAQAQARDAKAAKGFVPPQEQPACIAGGNLMPFQMEGLQWLLYKHFKRESCILADDMGLGKTVQIASVLGYLGSAEYQIYPCLVVVPNSTITNWVREFEKWSPHLRVVPFYGEKTSRQIITQYELYHKGQQGQVAGLKAHIVLTTYDMVTGNEFKVFSSVPRWEVLCVDEGQRLKSDESKIFSNLKTIRSVHRILLTGTPLNNNIRELFNLLNFLDRDAFSNLEAMEREYDVLDEGKVQKLHEMIKPYILRRIKADVLRLPPKVEIIVPITLTPVQKQVYKGIFERNADVIREILRVRQRRLKAKNHVQITGPENGDTTRESALADAGPSGA